MKPSDRALHDRAAERLRRAAGQAPRLVTPRDVWESYWSEGEGSAEGLGFLEPNASESATRYARRLRRGCSDGLYAFVVEDICDLDWPTAANRLESAIDDLAALKKRLTEIFGD